MRRASCLHKFYYLVDDINNKMKLFIQKIQSVTQINKSICYPASLIKADWFERVG